MLYNGLFAEKSMRDFRGLNSWAELHVESSWLAKPCQQCMCFSGFKRSEATKPIDSQCQWLVMQGPMTRTTRTKIPVVVEVKKGSLPSTPEDL